MSESLEQSITKYFNTRKAGISYSSIINGKVQQPQAFGIRKSVFWPWQSAPLITTNTRFQAASVSKPITACAVLKLVEQGVLDLDVDINTYLGSTGWQLKIAEKNDFIIDGKVPTVTLRHLLSHTAGISCHGFLGYNFKDSVPTTREILDGVKINHSKIELAFEHGKYSYSGGGYTIVQYILETVCQKPFDALMKELILDPLNMKNSSYTLEKSDKEYLANAIGTWWFPPWVFYGNLPYSLHPESAAAGLWTTPGDLILLSKALLDSYNGVPNAFFKPQAIKEFSTNQVTGANESELFGIGWAVKNYQNNLTISHNGSNTGFKAQLIIQFSTNSAIVVMHNKEQYNLLHPVLNVLVKSCGMVIEKEYKGWEITAQDLMSMWVEYIWDLVF
ncbi:hypothetical protein HDV02_000397 [Globomyces sp. JEL0801]|nr:hypothetical protein HDV02_000397 [Globomyces sp. JEL0801]